MNQPDLWGDETFSGVPMADITTLFQHWVDTFSKRASTQLDESRKKKIAAALKAYGMDTCKQAVEGCALSPWHTGTNPNNKKYTDISLILRNADRVEFFVEMYEDEHSAEAETNVWLSE